MPGNVRRLTDASPADWYASLPPISKFYATACTLSTLGIMLNLLPFSWFVLNWPAVFKGFQVWRLVLNFFFIGTKFQFLMRLIWILQYGLSLEKTTFEFDPAEFVFMYLFGAGSMLLLSFFWRTLAPVYGPALVFMLVYIWSRHNKDEQVSLYGLITVQGFYLPFLFLGADLLMGADVISPTVGIVIGHLYYYLTYLHPQATGQRLLETPNWLRQMLAQYGIGYSGTSGAVRGGQDTTAATGSTSGFRAFQGQARRLNAHAS